MNYLYLQIVLSSLALATLLIYIMLKPNVGGQTRLSVFASDKKFYIPLFFGSWLSFAIAVAIPHWAIL